MTIGRPTYGASVLDHLGITTVFEDEGPYPTVDLDEVRRRNPDVVLAPSEPYPFTKRQLPELSSVAPTTLRGRTRSLLVGRSHPERAGPVGRFDLRRMTQRVRNSPVAISAQASDVSHSASSTTRPGPSRKTSFRSWNSMTALR